MERTKRQGLIWLGLTALCISLFIGHRTKLQPTGYDRQSLDELVQQHSPASARDRDADIVTGSIAPSTGETALHKYYISFGSYGSIDAATKRYLDVISRKPVLTETETVSVETLQASGGTLYRVRMGAFDSVWAARSSCLTAGFASDECKALPIR